MKIIKNLLLLALFTVSLGFVFSGKALAVDCSPPISGDYSVSASCTFPGTIDGVDSGTGSSNSAVLSINSGATLTVNAGQTIAFGLINLAGGTIAINSTAQLKKMPIWVENADGDTHPASADPGKAIQSSQPGGYARRNLLSVWTADCDDNDNTKWDNTTLYTDADSDDYGVPAVNITRRSSSSGSGTSTSIAIAKPTGTASGDVMIAALSFGGSATVTPPDGWTQIARYDNNETNVVSLVTFYKVAGGSEPSSYTWTFNMSLTSAGVISSYENVDNSSPIDSYDGQTVGTEAATTQSFSTPSIVTSINNAMIVTFTGSFYTGDCGRGCPELLWTPPSGMSEAVEKQNSARSMEMADVLQASAGSTGVKTATANYAQYGAASIISLKPAYNSSIQCIGDTAPAGYAANNTDCNDSDNTKYQNINGYTDSDGDNYGTGSLAPVCSGASIASGYTTANNTDCNDSSASVYQNLVCYSNNTTYNYTGGQQTYVVPGGVTSVKITAYGGKGGDGWGSATGANGAKATGIITTTPGETLYIYVGNSGTNGSSSGLSVSGGYNGGGTGAGSSYYASDGGGSGAGASDVRQGGTAVGNRVIVAGGGGGGGGMSPWDNTAGDGGAGGGPNGVTAISGGGGGTQSAVGSGASCSGVSNCGVGSNGSSNSGGAGGQGMGGGGGGAGGGYYGGGGGHSGGGDSTYSAGDGGGGGSSWVTPSASSISHTEGANNGAGYVVISTQQTTCTGASCP